MPGLFKAADAIGTIHSSRFTILSEKTLLFLGDFDGEFGQLMADLAKRRRASVRRDFPACGEPAAYAGRQQRGRLRRMDRGASAPRGKSLHRLPDVTVKEIKALASAAGVTGAGEQLPFLVILPIKSKLAFVEVQLLLRARGHRTTKDLATVGTPHFAQFMPLEDNQIGFFTVYDGTFDKYIADFTKNIGQVFDLIFKFTKDPPPSPCRKHLQEFIDFAAGATALRSGSIRRIRA